MDLKIHMTLKYLKIQFRILMMASHVYMGRRINNGYWAVFDKEITGYFDRSVSTQTSHLSAQQVTGSLLSG